MGKAKRILVVEDDSGVASVVAAVLKDRAHAVLTAGSIAKAEAALDAGGVDAIILDRILPDGDGIELFRKLKTSRALSRIPVLVLSCKAGPGEQVEGLDLGADDYVTKPFSSHELRARVQALLRRAGKFAR